MLLPTAAVEGPVPPQHGGPTMGGAPGRRARGSGAAAAAAAVAAAPRAGSGAGELGAGGDRCAHCGGAVQLCDEAERAIRVMLCSAMRSSPGSGTVPLKPRHVLLAVNGATRTGPLRNGAGLRTKRWTEADAGAGIGGDQLKDVAGCNCTEHPGLPPPRLQQLAVRGLAQPKPPALAAVITRLLPSWPPLPATAASHAAGRPHTGDGDQLCTPAGTGGDQQFWAVVTAAPSGPLQPPLPAGEHHPLVGGEKL